MNGGGVYATAMDGDGDVDGDGAAGTGAGRFCSAAVQIVRVPFSLLFVILLWSPPYDVHTKSGRCGGMVGQRVRQMCPRCPMQLCSDGNSRPLLSRLFSLTVRALATAFVCTFEDGTNEAPSADGEAKVRTSFELCVLFTGRGVMLSG